MGIIVFELEYFIKVHETTQDKLIIVPLIFNFIFKPCFRILRILIVNNKFH